MKKFWVLLIAAAVLAIGAYGISYANGKGNGISDNGDPHNFVDNIKKNVLVANSEVWNGRKEICRVCHVPHDHARATKRWQNGLLWNHAVDDTTTFTMYDHTWSNTITGTQSTQPDGTAKLCLGCHDGVVAIDTFDSYTGGAANIMNYSAGYKVPGYTDTDWNNLRGTHPLSIEFPAGERGDGINFKDPETETWDNGATVASTLDNGKVQCSTCHDVHDQAAVIGTHLLRDYNSTAAMGNADFNASKLCLTCHDK